MVITSKENRFVSSAVKLKDKKGRSEQGRFLIEGQKLVNDAFKRGVEILRVFVTEENSEKYSAFDCECLVVSEQVMKHISDTKTNQGVIAEAVIPAEQKYDGKKALLLDRIQDPRNMGAILRTACAAGYQNVFLVDCVDVFSPVAVRCGMSGQFSLKFFEISQEKFLKNFDESFTVCADMEGENVFDIECPEDHVLILGNEGQGISEEFLKRADKKVKIPMKNNLESLNVAVSGGIIMYELNRSQWR